MLLEHLCQTSEHLFVRCKALDKVIHLSCVPFILCSLIYFFDGLQKHQFLLVRKHLEQFITCVLLIALSGICTTYNFSEVPVPDLFSPQIYSVLVVTCEVDLELPPV